MEYHGEVADEEEVEGCLPPGVPPIPRELWFLPDDMFLMNFEAMLAEIDPPEELAMPSYFLLQGVQPTLDARDETGDRSYMDRALWLCQEAFERSPHGHLYAEQAVDALAQIKRMKQYSLFSDNSRAIQTSILGERLAHAGLGEEFALMVMRASAGQSPAIAEAFGEMNRVIRHATQAQVLRGLGAIGLASQMCYCTTFDLNDLEHAKAAYLSLNQVDPTWRQVEITKDFVVEWVQCCRECSIRSPDPDSLVDEIATSNGAHRIPWLDGPQLEKVQNLRIDAEMRWFFLPSRQPTVEEHVMFTLLDEDLFSKSTRFTQGTDSTKGTESRIDGKMSDLPEYLYESLNDPAKEIRLLTIQPGNAQHPISCQLHTVRLDSGPEYEALSYTWGDPSIKHDISLDNQHFTVTTNLYSALIGLRLSDRPRALWIDAICINQNDNHEKSFQIGLMREIYAYTKEVIMWIGEPDVIVTETAGMTVDVSQSSPEERAELQEAMRAPIECAPLSVNEPSISETDRERLEADLARQDAVAASLTWPRPPSFDWRDRASIRRFFHTSLAPSEWPVLGAFGIIYSLSIGRHFPELPFFQQHHPSGHHSHDDHLYHDSQAWMHSAMALVAFFRHSYWTRAWIFQEIVLPKTATVYYQGHIMPFEHIITAYEHFRFHRYECCAGFSQGRVPKGHRGFNGTIVTRDDRGPVPDLSLWQTFETSMDFLGQVIRFRQGRYAARRGVPANLTFFDAIGGLEGARKASAKHDIVYSVLGLPLDGGEADIKVDYDLPIADVFAQATIKMIKDAGSLAPLERCDVLGHSGEEAPDKPSWVPDWSKKHESTIWHWDLFHAARDRKFEGVSITKDLGMILSTRHIDTVMRLGKAPCDRLTENYGLSLLACITELIIHWKALWRASRSRSKKASHGNEDESFWSTIFAGVWEDIEVHPKSKEVKSDFTQPLTHGKPYSKRVRRFATSDMAWIEPLRRFVHCWESFLITSQSSAKASSAELARTNMGRAFLALFFRLNELDYVARNRPDQNKESMTNNVIRLRNAIQGRRIFTTASGRLGLAGCNHADQGTVVGIEEGDEVHVVAGSALPVLLRRMPNEDGDQSLRQFAGFCYVDGTMNGEACGGESDMQKVILQ